MPKYLLAAGGTGGHIFPAIAVAKEILRQQPDSTVEFVGAEGGMETRLVQAADFALHTLWISGLYRQFTFNNLKRNSLLPFKLLYSHIQAKKLLKSYKPDWVIGFGGYASFAVVRAAIGKQNIRTAIMEQNAWPGLANRRLAPKVNKVFVGYDAAGKFLNSKETVVTGNPVRPEIGQISKEDARRTLGFSTEKPLLFVTGGSLGARTLNQALQHNLQLLSENGIQVLWQCGKYYIEDLKSLAEGNSYLQIVDFIPRMDCAYAAADLAICRAGALTLAELETARLPAILVPSPNVAGDHQTANAKHHCQDSSGVLITEAEVAKNLISKAVHLLQNKVDLYSMQLALQRRPVHNAARLLVNHLIHSANG